MANSSDKAYERDMLMLELAGGCDGYGADCELSDYDDAIEEYNSLLQYAIDRNDKEQIRMLRAEIQRTKVEKRISKRMIDTSQNRMEIAYT